MPKVAATKKQDAESTPAWADGIIGHAAAIGFLERARRTERLAHACLLVGPERTGKVTVARRFAAAMLGVTNPDTHPDFTFVERGVDAKTGKPHAGILLDQVHALTGRLALSAMMVGWKVCVIDGANLLNKESANALLKTLEEPNPRTLMLLTATSPEQVIATIRSRCQIIRMHRVATPEIAAALVRRGLEPGAAELCARLSDGRPGAAVRFAEDRSSLDGMFAMRDVILDMADGAIADRFRSVERILPPKLPFQDSVDRARDWLDLAAELLRDAMLVRLGLPERATHVDVQDRIAAWAQRFDPEAALRDVETSRRLLDANVTPRGALERVTLAFR